MTFDDIAGDGSIESGGPAVHREAWRSLPRSLMVAAVLTVVVGFAFGFVSATRGSGGRRADVASPPAIGSRLSTSTSTTEPLTTSSVVTSIATTSISVATTAPIIVTAPPTTPPTIVTTQRTVVVTVTAPPTTVASPPRVEVTFARDGSGRLVLPRNGSSQLTITNSGGQASQWLVTGSGFRTTGSGSAQGTLQPGQSATVTVQPPQGELPNNEINGTIQVLGALNSVVPFVIPQK